MSTIEHVVIAAAGIGKRLGQGIPKILVKINGKPIYEYLLAAFKDVKDIRIVVGFEAEKVIHRITDYRKDIIFVKNHDYQNTLTYTSCYLGAVGIEGKVLFVDGDTILSNKTLEDIKKLVYDDIPFLSVSKNIADNPVYAHVENGFVTSFSRNQISEYEWANVAYVDISNLSYENTHVYEQMEKLLPMKALEIERIEVDTPHDLEIANETLKNEPYYIGE